MKYHSKKDHVLEFKRYSKASSANDASLVERFAPHCDLSTITLLHQDISAGLQIYDKNNQSWIDVPALEDTILVNTG